LINLGIFLAGVALLWNGFFKAGLAVILGITLIELYALFRSQIIVQSHNLKTQKRILSEL
jgi:hypothetical protein